jgi:DNA-directed RNA polymerase subunit RPC12/RpoP
MPPALAAETATAAALSANGQAVGGLISAKVATLTEAGLVGMFTSKTKASLIALLITLILGSTPLLGHFLVAQPATRDLRHDFRLGTPLPDWLQMSGPLKDARIDSADKGMRIVLPGERKLNLPVGVETKLVLTGDFEVTADFEILSAERPTGGYGVGVSLNVARAADRKLFGKVARFWRAREGSVFISEFWNNEDPPMPRTLNSIPTEARIGRLRLVRKGDMLHYLAAEGLGNDFQEVFQERFTAEDLTHLRFVVSDSGEPGNAVDARLLQLQIFGNKLTGVEVQRPQIVAPVAQTPPAAPIVPEQEPTEMNNVRMLWPCLAVFGLVIPVAASLVLWRVLRRSKKKSVAKPSVATAISFACSACGKNLKVRPSVAGKRVKCPHCGQGMLAPENQKSGVKP